MNNDVEKLRQLLRGMREAYLHGENAMAYARKSLARLGVSERNETIATLIAYDLQAGSYVAEARNNIGFNQKWCDQLGTILSPLVGKEASLLEVGCGEATTLAGVLATLDNYAGHASGFDISWSRVTVGESWLGENGKKAKLFVGDLFSIPLGSNSVDVVYTSHSIEPNGGREVEAISELLRVARRWVVLVEPAYEFANPEGKKRMEEHGYVRGLQDAAKQCGAKIVEHRLLEITGNPLNPSGLLLLEKPYKETGNVSEMSWQCPITGTTLCDNGDAFISKDTGLVYPVLRGIPMLRAEHAIVASKLID